MLYELLQGHHRAHKAHPTRTRRLPQTRTRQPHPARLQRSTVHRHLAIIQTRHPNHANRHDVNEHANPLRPAGTPSNPPTRRQAGHQAYPNQLI